MLQGNPRAPGTYLWGHNAISDESPALVEEGVLHPVEYKSRDLPKTRTLTSLKFVYQAF